MITEEFEKFAKLELQALEKGIEEQNECLERQRHSLDLLRAYIRAIGTRNINKITSNKDGYDFTYLKDEVEKIDKENGIDERTTYYGI